MTLKKWSDITLTIGTTALASTVLSCAFLLLVIAGATR